MIVYRLCRSPHVKLDGEGARLFGGRWNSQGRAAIYTAGSPSLAVLEVLVHLDLPPDLLPNDYRLLSVQIPDEGPFETLDAPDDAVACLAAGDDFLARGAALGLRVPSVVVPQERNTILNPSHPAAARMLILQNDPFGFDPRLVSP